MLEVTLAYFFFFPFSQEGLGGVKKGGLWDTRVRGKKAVKRKGRLPQHAALRYEAVLPLSFSFILKLSNKNGSVREPFSSASHTASLEVKCSLISSLIKLL